MPDSKSALNESTFSTSREWGMRPTLEEFMFKHCMAAILLASLCAFSTPLAQAFVDPPYLTPAMPVAEDGVSVNVRHGGCDVIVSFPGYYPQVTREGSKIHVVFAGYRYGDPELCFWEPYTSLASIGSFSPGDYTLQVDFFYGDGIGDVHTIALGVLPFTVMAAQATAAPVPAGGAAGFILLVLVIGGLAASMLRLPSQVPLGVRGEGSKIVDPSQDRQAATKIAVAFPARQGVRLSSPRP